MRTVFTTHTSFIGRRTLIWCVVCCLNVPLAPTAMAQDGRLAIEYTINVADIPGQLFHVTTDIRNINQPALELSLPVWSPGWCAIENYTKNILRFRVTPLLSALRVRRCGSATRKVPGYRTWL
jgi:hypothetical protein